MEVVGALHNFPWHELALAFDLTQNGPEKKIINRNKIKLNDVWGGMKCEKLFLTTSHLFFVQTTQRHYQ